MEQEKTGFVKLPYYHNNRILKPNGELFMFGGDGKIQVYIKNDLCTILGTNEFNGIDLQLKKDPNIIGEMDEYHLHPKYDVCVVTGGTDGLIRARIIPELFTKHFPAWFKDHNEHDFVLITRHIFERYYNNYLLPFLDNYAKKLGAITIDENVANFRAKSKPYHAALVALKNRDKMPAEAFKKHQEWFTESSGLEATDENLQKYVDTKHLLVLPDYGEYFYQYLTNKDDLLNFAKELRQLFIEKLKPQHLPIGFNIDGLKYRKIA